MVWVSPSMWCEDFLLSCQALPAFRSKALSAMLDDEEEGVKSGVVSESWIDKLDLWIWDKSFLEISNNTIHTLDLNLSTTFFITSDFFGENGPSQCLILSKTLSSFLSLTLEHGWHIWSYIEWTCLRKNNPLGKIKWEKKVSGECLGEWLIEVQNLVKLWWSLNKFDLISTFFRSSTWMVWISQ